MDEINKLKELISQALEDEEKRKAAFYADPMHWDNNKRRRNGLPVLRGLVNKQRSKAFYCRGIFSCEIFDLLDEIISDAIEGGITGECFDNYVSINDLNTGDCSTFHIE